MNKKFTLISIVAVIISFIGGFLLANGLNRAELEKARAEIAGLQKKETENQNQQAEFTLTNEEINKRIAEADQNPNNFEYHKKLGISLYKYASMKKDVELLGKAEKILERANRLNEKDYDIIVSLGNLNFDIGYFNNENEKFQKARQFYQAALNQKPDDIDVTTEIGMTYLLQNPPDTTKAKVEFQKTLAKNPKNERCLYYLTQTFLKEGNDADAEKTLAKLKEINPQTPTLNEVRKQINGQNQPETK